MLLVAVGCTLVVALTGGGRTAGSVPRTAVRPTVPATVVQPTAPSSRATSYSVMQMNLCLSGLAGCYPTVAYPAEVRDALARISDERPDAVTMNEVCSGDVRHIARAAGYHVRFATVDYGGAPLGCIRPGGRGLFGDAVLTTAAVDVSATRAFAAQSGLEERRWLCVTTRRAPEVCTAHLATRRTRVSAATNDAQCAELGALIARRSAGHVLVFGGDVNRRGSCAPDGTWSRSDGSAGQSPGVQHVYGSRHALGSPSWEVLPAPHSDHDTLLVRTRLLRTAP